MSELRVGKTQTTVLPRFTFPCVSLQREQVSQAPWLALSVCLRFFRYAMSVLHLDMICTASKVRSGEKISSVAVGPGAVAVTVRAMIKARRYLEEDKIDVKQHARFRLLPHR